MALWTPALTTTALWLDAADSSTITNGTGVSQWDDKSGNGRHATQSNPSNQPSVLSSGLDGKDVVRFDATLTSAEFLNIALGASSSNCYIFCVLSIDQDPPSAADFTGIWRLSTDPTQNSHYPFTDGVIYQAFGTNSRKTTVNPTTSLAKANVYAIRSETGLYRTFLNGTQLSSTGINTPGLPANAKLGQSLDSDRSMNGYFAEVVIIRDTTLSQEDQDRMVGYLAHKWGLEADLPADHPYKAAAPEQIVNLWTPSVITSGLWLDAADSSTITIGTGVSQWDDKSGNSRHASQATGSLQPSVSSGSINALDTILFTNTQRLSGSPPISGTGDRAFFAVTRPSSFTNPNYIYSNLDDAAGTTGQNWIVSLENGQIALRVTGNALYPTTTTTDTQLVSMIWGDGDTDSIDTECRLNTSVLTVSGSSSNVTINTRGDGNYDIGNRAASGEGFTGNIAEILILNRVPTTEERQIIEGYLAYKWGFRGELPIGHPYRSNPPQITLNIITTFLDELYNLEADLIMQIVNEVYSLTDSIGNSILNEPYGLFLGAFLNENYGNSPVITSFLNQFYGDRQMLQKVTNILYGDTRGIIAVFDEPYTIRAELLQVLNERYTITEKQITAALEQLYDLLLRNPLIKTLDELYAITADTIIEKQDLIVTIDGTRVEPTLVNYEFNIEEYGASCTLELAKLEEFQLVEEFRSVISITDSDGTFEFMAEIPTIQETVEATTYIVNGYSKSLVLERAERFTMDFPGGLVSEAADQIANPWGITVDWQAYNYYIPPNLFYINDETPLEALRRLSSAIGARLQPTDDGNIRVVREYPFDTTRWETSPVSWILTDQRDFFSTGETVELRDNYNVYRITDQDVPEDDMFLREESIDSTTKLLKGYHVPFGESDVVLRTSGGSQTIIEPMGVIIETLPPETIEIVGGEGTTSLPIFNVISTNYRFDSLGAITPNEDGTLTTDIPGQSLVEITYQTRYRLWRVKDPRVGQIQFWLEGTR